MEFPRIRTHPHNNKKTSYEEKKTYIGNKSKQKNLKKNPIKSTYLFFRLGKKRQTNETYRELVFQQNGS